ncbi:MAG: exo-alpha-sialidase, partial [Glycomyces artemisiae]|nr:exo-alpha-sialidase [Glycomyces artemisiae]
GTLMASTCNNWGPDEILFRSTDSGATWSLSWDLVSENVRTDRFAMDSTGSPWLTWLGADNGASYAVKHGWMIEALAIDPHDSDRIMWGTGATVWGTESLTQWDAQGDLIGENEAGERVALPIDKFTVGVRAEGIEMTAVRDLAALGGALVSAKGDVNGFVHTDLDRAEPMFRKDWSGYSLDYAASDRDIVVGSGDVGSDTAGHVTYSTDRGRTWQDTTRVAGTPNGAGGVVAITADAAAIVWSPGNTTLAPVRSTDLGRTWTPVQGLPAQARVRSDRVDGSVVYAYSGGRFYRSTDAGATFADTGATGLPAEGVDDFRTAPGRNGHVWLCGRSDKAEVPKGLWHSKDGGATWTRLAAVDLAIGVGFGKSASRNGYPAIYATATVGGQEGFFRSTDGGATWCRINDDAHQWGFAGSVITGDPEIYGRVYLSARGIVYGDIA